MWFVERRLGPGRSPAAAGAPAAGSARFSRDWVSIGLANEFPRAPATGVFVEHKRLVKYTLTFTECELFLPASSLGRGSVPRRHPVYGCVCVHLKARETTRFGGQRVGLERKAEAPRHAVGAGSSADPSSLAAERSGSRRKLRVSPGAAPCCCRSLDGRFSYN